MATYVLHIASGLFFRIGVSLSLSILQQETIHESFIAEKIRAGRRKIKIEIKFYTSIALELAFL
jgi:hypothetical protein